MSVGVKDKRQFVSIGLVLLVGLVLSWSATRDAIRSAEKEARTKFDFTAELMVERVRQELLRERDLAHNLHAFSKATSNTAPGPLRAYLDEETQFYRHRRMVGMAVAVPPDDARNILDRIRAQGADGFQFRDGRGGEIAPQAVNKTLYPLVGAWSPEAERADAWTGIDMGNLPGLRGLLSKSLSEHRSIVVPLSTPAQTMFAARGGVWLITPFKDIYGFPGFAVQIVELSRIVRGGTDEPRFEGLNLALKTVSPATGGTVTLTYLSERGLSRSGAARGDSAFRLDQRMDVGLRDWQASVWAAPGVFVPDLGRAVIEGIVVLMLTVLVIYILWTQAQRQQRVSAIVERRTSALREAHREMEEHNELLQNLNRDLEEAREAAEAANEAKSEFLATVSHELRTPLNTILGFSQFLKDEPLGPLGDERYQDYARDIHHSGSYLLRLINDILDLAKLEAGKISIEAGALSPEFLTDRVIALLYQQADAKGLRLSAHVDEGMPDFINGDELRLRQILTNLASNAIKFTDEGEVRIKIYPKRFLTGKPGYVMKVSDTGIGIPKEKQAVLFDRFTQVESSHSRSHGGVGLGLAICRELVERMSGTIHVSSKVGHGTEMWVHLPLQEASATSDEDVENMMI
ncbi:sensor histidine kinase [Yunchengibacter salinarum]|uniref:sensor histidine kinase n=1 Tax=Yunchengibacter salinarum TaxID=3133399 RepID=UPI0035B6054B